MWNRVYICSIEKQTVVYPWLFVVGTIIGQSAPKIPLPRRRAPFTAGPIQRTIKDVMSTAVFRQLGALPPHVTEPLLLVCPLRTSTLATLATFLPYPTRNPLDHPPNPLLPRIPMPSPPVPRLLISGHSFPLFSPSSRPCLANWFNRPALYSPCSLLSCLVLPHNGCRLTSCSLERQRPFFASFGTPNVPRYAQNWYSPVFGNTLYVP